MSIALKDVPRFSKLFKDFLSNNESAEDLSFGLPDLDSFRGAIYRKREFERSSVLVAALKDQYRDVVCSPLVQDNIDSLSRKETYTVTTGHQLCVGLGPLYTLYKALTVIDTCEQLKIEFPENHFVPVFWLASEDHDYEEIKAFELFGESFSWETTQTGGVGRFKTDGLKELCEALPEKIEALDSAYEKKDLAKASHALLNDLLGAYGLVVLDPDRAELKKLVAPQFIREIKEKVGQSKVFESSSIMKARGYKPQVNARPVNLFRLTDESRLRLEVTSTHLREVGGSWTLPLAEVDSYVNENPGEFSPNVILRPLYQEVLLPNLAYVGGPGETAYWLQLKQMFEAFEVPFPLVMPRNHMLLLTAPVKKKLEKFELSPEVLFLGEDHLKKMISEQTDGPNLAQELIEMEEVYRGIVKKALSIDPTLEGYVKSEANKTLKQLNNVYGKLKKAHEKRHEDRITQVNTTYNKLFPNGGLQEREQSMWSFSLNDPEFISKVKKGINAFSYDFKVVDLTKS